MQKNDIIAFFDSRAENWDAEMIKNDEVICDILDNAHVGENIEILDVACGTGVMFPYYLRRGVKSVTGIDISPKMADIAREKFAGDEHVSVICGDVEESVFKQEFDVIMVYNAFPHFPEPERLIAKLASLLKDGGRLSIAHGASRKTIDSHHKGPASKVSMGLMSADRLSVLFEPYFTVEHVISDERMYQVSGVKRGKSTL